MSGILQPSIIHGFEDSFIQNCLCLIGEAFVHIRENRDITIDCDEENISANVSDYIDNSERANNWNITIAAEHRLFTSAILAGKKPAKGAKRIDFRMSLYCMEQRKRIYFWIEAKNLIESDCFKNGRKTKLHARKLHEEYIRSGIDRFVSGSYPVKGCMVGYVLQGAPGNILLKINAQLQGESSRTAQHYLINLS